MTPFLAVSNLSYNALPAGHGYPNQEASFATIEEARAWLKSRGGGAISTHRSGDWSVIETVRPN